MNMLSIMKLLTMDEQKMKNAGNDEHVENDENYENDENDEHVRTTIKLMNMMNMLNMNQDENGAKDRNYEMMRMLSVKN